ncbi:UDP-N-acetylmuramoyl-tripeptide--D-alanyl-D-alanine ligase [Methylopila jiangsuensis]|uniref:UDP-N-acetylmuramoyl-tripeptide--D-alanyl-D-alanine ligase n=1 Tax=Methylopila jiangsuensis TaxID=586230 RepID=A0A9W6JGX5_9HYPH|nr:UDP-N-acetylmuramoylalanyl-D-glutamyl-2,6-diaminopimelate--D-alanyl-D-alanine ligase [Methylopila jiangsuensis]MDR6286275.1 UDP-N-acetylmuramoyl-tripeptide--D-alanyl-D-alanine ligase [Methylopila jiangsuensis]GLK76038.1 UDP-N-acetylmuramoyl-tripeptide--D-alanyl-D-alanine ligase [Methylopila jiangsuensis]
MPLSLFAEPLWTPPELALATAGRLLGKAQDALAGISIDSRTAATGDVFFAIRGDVHDGHGFVRAAFERGAALAVVDEAHADDLADAGPLLVVADVLAAMVATGVAARARSRARIVAVTGSVGKTSTKEALRLVLAADGPTHASAASHNNHWGVPLTLSRLPRGASYGVFEIGMNHPDEIRPLTKMVRPHVAIVTNVEPVHLAAFESVERIADAKAEIFEGLVRGGHAVVNRDNPHYERLKAAATEAGAAVWSFGEHVSADARLDRAALKPDGSTVAATILGDQVAFKIGAPGRHVVQNALAVLLAAKLAGADLALAALALAGFTPPAGRGRRYELDAPGGALTLIDESYNANPASMRAALALLGQTPVSGSGRRIAVLGDMLELGETTRELHAKVAEAVAAAKIDLAFTAGPLMKALHEALPAQRRGGWAPTAAELEPLVLERVRGGDAVMVKGSNGSKLGPVVAALRARFEPARGLDDVALGAR